MTQTDIQQIAGLLEKQKGEILSQVDEKLKQQDKRFDQKLEKQTNDIDQRFAQQTKEIDQKLEKQTKEILGNVADYIADSLTPLLEKQDERLAHLERHNVHPPGTPVSI